MVIVLNLFCSYGQLPLIQANITCGDTVYGTTTQSDTIHYYHFLSTSNDSSYLTANTCNDGTNYDTDIYIYDQNVTELMYNDGEESCSWKSRLTYGPVLLNKQYLIAITGYEYDYGSYSMEVSCFEKITKTCMLISTDAYLCDLDLVTFTIYSIIDFVRFLYYFDLSLHVVF